MSSSNIIFVRKVGMSADSRQRNATIVGKKNKCRAQLTLTSLILPLHKFSKPHPFFMDTGADTHSKFMESVYVSIICMQRNCQIHKQTGVPEQKHVLHTELHHSIFFKSHIS